MINSKSENIINLLLVLIQSEARSTDLRYLQVFFDFSLTVKAAPHECVIRTGQP